MAIESAFNSNSFPLSSLGEVGEDLPIEIVDSESLILETDDGGMMIEFDPDPEGMAEVEFDSNLAEYVDDKELRKLASEIIHLSKSDKE